MLTYFEIKFNASFVYAIIFYKGVYLEVWNFFFQNKKSEYIYFQNRFIFWWHDKSWAGGILILFFKRSSSEVEEEEEEKQTNFLWENKENVFQLEIVLKLVVYTKFCRRMLFLVVNSQLMEKFVLNMLIWV